MKDAEQERWDREHADKIEEERVGKQIVAAISDLLAGRKVIVAERTDEHRTIWSVTTP